MNAEYSEISGVPSNNNRNVRKFLNGSNKISNDENEMDKSMEENALKSQESETAHKFNLLKRVISASGSQYRERGSHKRDRGKSAPVVQNEEEKASSVNLRRGSNPVSYQRFNMASNFETRD